MSHHYGRDMDPVLAGHSQRDTASEGKLSHSDLETPPIVLYNQYKPKTPSEKNCRRSNISSVYASRKYASPPKEYRVTKVPNRNDDFAIHIATTRRQAPRRRPQQEPASYSDPKARTKLKGRNDPRDFKNVVVALHDDTFIGPSDLRFGDDSAREKNQAAQPKSKPKPKREPARQNETKPKPVVEPAKKPTQDDSSWQQKPIKSERHPVVVWSLLAINIIMFIITMGSADWEFASFSENPSLGPSYTVFRSMGAKYEPDIVNGDWWRLISAGFLHGGIIHLFLNMWVLWRIGSALEEVFGSMSFGSIYMISLVSGNLSSAVFLPDRLSVGASGAIYGTIGAMFADLIQNWSIMPDDRFCYLTSLIINTIIGLLLGLVPLLDNFGHIGGLIAGFFIGMLLLVLPRWNRKKQSWFWPTYSKVLAAISLCMLIVWLSVMFSLLYSSVDGNEWCPSCRYLSCVDTPLWQCPP